MMSLDTFLTDLFEHGRVAVAPPSPTSNEELHAAERVLKEREEICRAELPADMPALSVAPALSAARQFQLACQIAMFRDLGEDAVAKLAKSEIEGWDQPAVHYSVDITFCFLPDLLNIARSAASDDPLVAVLTQWCRRWPLSSVGVKDVGEVEVEPILQSASLTQIYVDRILARDDVGRLSSLPVASAVRRSLGLYLHLAPKFQSVLDGR
jgi:hypothetical protein